MNDYQKAKIFQMPSFESFNQSLMTEIVMFFKTKMFLLRAKFDAFF